MLKIFILNYLLYYINASPLQEITHKIDEYFDELDGDPQTKIKDIEAFKMMLKRTYYRYPETNHVSKRSLDEKTTLIRDEKGVYILKSVEEEATVPTKFPNDIVLSLYENEIYAITLENGKKPWNLADELVVYKYVINGTFKPTARKSVSGASTLSVEIVKGSMFIAFAEYNGDQNQYPFQGSKLYKMTPFENDLEEVQILDVIHQQDLKFVQYLDQLYLIVAAEGATNKTSNLFIYKWLGLHFDRIQKISTNSISSLAVFTIENSLYLAVSNHEDIHGDTDIKSGIFKFHLQDNKFKQYQMIKTHGAKDVKHFSFSDSDSKEEHFIIYANFFSRNEDGSRNYESDSVVYKYVDNYFVPFQSFNLYGAKQWIPIVGTDNEFLLMVVCKYGIIGYQYDGWRFTKIPLSLPGSNLDRNILSVRAYEFSKKFFLAVADKNNDGTDSNIWLLTFMKRNIVEEQYNEVENWCEQMLSDLSALKFDDPFKKVAEVTEDGFNFKVPVKFKNAVIDNVITEDFGEVGDDFVKEVNELSKEVNNLKSLLQDKDNFQNNLGDLNTEPINMPYLELDCKSSESCFFENLHFKKLNGEDWDLFKKNAIPLDEEITIGGLIEFENVIVKNSFTPKYLNGHPVETLHDVNEDRLINGELVVNGTVIIHGELILDGYLDGVLINDKNVFLKKRAQNFSSSLSVPSVEVENLKLKGKINKQRLDDLLKNSPVELEDTYDDLNVNSISVKGLVNGYNLSDIINALNQSQDQDAKGELFFTNATVDDVRIDSNLISGVNLSDLIDISKNGSCSFNGTLIFEQDELKVNILIVSKINSVPVDDYFSQGRNAKSRNFPDVIIVEGNFIAQDIQDLNKNLSLLNIFKNGLRLDEKIIDSEFQFSNIIVNDLIADEINNVPVNSMIFKNFTEPLVIKGRKVFTGNVEILNKSHVYWVDGIDMEELERQALRLKDIQNASKNLTFENIECEKITANTTRLGGEDLADLNHFQKRVIVKGNLIADKMDTEDSNIFGTIDDIFLDDMFNDSIFEDSDVEYFITGEKIINGTLIVDDLYLNGSINDMDFEEFFELEPKDYVELVLNESVSLNTTLKMDSLIFEGMLDSIRSEDFGNEWLLTDGDQIIDSALTFQNVKLKSGCSLKNKIINRINITDLIENTLKINENATVKSLQAMKIIATNVDINGTVNGAKFRDAVVQSNSSTPQIIKGHWLFNHDLIINGNLIVEKFVSGLNVSHLCSLKIGEEDEVNVIVGGSVKFEEEPEILETVNGINISGVMDKIWLKTENATLTGKVSFVNVTTHDTTQLKGFLNGVNLTDFAKNYINKKTTSFIPADMEFKSIEISGDARIRNSTVKGKVNGIDLEKFSKNVLLQDVDQVITGRIHFHNISIGNLNLNGTVNKLDLNKDVLRYDVENAVVTGEKRFEKLFVKEIGMSPGKSVQGVDVSDWAKNAVMLDGNITIEGDVTFAGPKVKIPNLTVTGKVNGVKFDRDHILTVEGNQVVTGKKYFDLRNYPDNAIKMNTLNVTGLIGGIDFEDLINNQAYKSRDLVFTKRMNFTNGLKANQLTVEGLFQGVNISEINDEMSRPMNTSEMDYKSDRLLNESMKIKKLVDDTPYFFDHFELVQTVRPDVTALLPFTFDADEELLLCAFMNNSLMDILKWDLFSQTFAPFDDIRRKVNMTFAAPKITSDKFYFYLETENKTILTDEDSTIEIQTNNTSTFDSFEIKSLNKTCIFVGRKLGNSKIFCNSSLINDLHTYQELETAGSLAASALNINDDIYIAVINKERYKEKMENVLVIYQFDQKLQHFQIVQTLPEINPIAVSTIFYDKTYYLVSAGGHLPESVQNSVLTIFRFDEDKGIFSRYHSILVDSLVDAKFAILPSSELFLYVLSSNPAKPFIVYSHKGIQGFVEETSGLALYRGSKLYPVTDKKDQHFVIISGYREGKRGQVLKAGFKGSKPKSKNHG